MHIKNLSQDRLGRCEAGPGQRKKPSLMGFGILGLEGLIGREVFPLLSDSNDAEVFEV